MNKIRVSFFESAWRAIDQLIAPGGDNPDEYERNRNLIIRGKQPGSMFKTARRMQSGDVKCIYIITPFGMVELIEDQYGTVTGWLPTGFSKLFPQCVGALSVEVQQFLIGCYFVDGCSIDNIGRKLQDALNGNKL